MHKEIRIRFVSALNFLVIRENPTNPMDAMNMRMPVKKMGGAYDSIIFPMGNERLQAKNKKKMDKRVVIITEVYRFLI